MPLGQVYRQNKCAFFVLTIHQRTGCKPGVLHHLQIGQAMDTPGLFDGFHLCGGDDAMIHVGTPIFRSYTL